MKCGKFLLSTQQEIKIKEKKTAKIKLYKLLKVKRQKIERNLCEDENDDRTR